MFNYFIPSQFNECNLFNFSYLFYFNEWCVHAKRIVPIAPHCVVLTIAVASLLVVFYFFFFPLVIFYWHSTDVHWSVLMRKAGLIFVCSLQCSKIAPFSLNCQGGDSSNAVNIHGIGLKYSWPYLTLIRKQFNFMHKWN